MMKNTSGINFSLIKVTTEQFAMIANAPVDDKNIKLATRFRFGVNITQRNIGVFVQFIFNETTNTPFLQIEGGCHFQIAQPDWDSLLGEDNKAVILPKGFAAHLLMLCVGTTRGLLHSKTENTPYNKFLIPLINVASLIEKDVVLEFKELSTTEEIISSKT